MAKRFFSLRIPIFGSVAMLLICLVFFLIPFSMRGARLGIQDMQNNVADWLPQHYSETQDLNEFQRHFYGGVFVVASGPWCKEGDPNFERLKEAIRKESLEYEADLNAAGNEEQLRAHRKGDELGLLYTGNYHQNWGEHNEKWLMGRNGVWYFINRQGQLFRWEGQNNVVQGMSRFFERMGNGKNKASGTYIDTFGSPPDDKNENAFYQNPERLCCRPFKSVVSGPDVFEQMAGPDGTLRIRKSGEDDLSAFEAKMEAHKRLTGALYGPTPDPDFKWTFDSLLQQVDSSMRKRLLADAGYRRVFEEFINRKVQDAYEGNFDRLLKETPATKLDIWYEIWFQLELEPPPRQTCLIVTLNEPIIQELARAIGRPLMGKPRGRLPELAIGICGINPDNFHMGGPPYDNVAIDEEGTNTLIRLAGLSFIIGVTLAYLSFGSMRVSLMLFFVGGSAAMSSLAFVWFGGKTMDAILMTMPSLVYVLGLSAAVHFVNYYRDACHESGPRRAAEIAVLHSWFPVLLAAFTTSLGLISLTTSNLTPIYKFGLFSAIAVFATVFLLYLYLPSALTIWSPGYRKMLPSTQQKKGGLAFWVGRFWERVGDAVISRPRTVAALMVALMICCASGLTQIKTTVQLLKLFDSSSKILYDYAWLERNLGELVPAEIVINIDRSAQREPYVETIRQSAIADAQQANQGQLSQEQIDELTIDFDRRTLDQKYSMLERVELSSRVRSQLEKFFGAEGMQVVGTGMSTDVFTPIYRLKSNADSSIRRNFSSALYAKRDEMLSQDYLAVVGQSTQLPLRPTSDATAESIAPHEIGREMWRISIRLAALNDVDYGRFVNDLKRVVEPILFAYEFRTKIIDEIYAVRGENARDEGVILLLGPDPDMRSASTQNSSNNTQSIDELVDQTYIFTDTLKALLENRGFVDRRSNRKKHYLWLDPQRIESGSQELTPVQQQQQLETLISQVDCVVLIEDNPMFQIDMIRKNAKKLVDCRQHLFLIDPINNQPLPGMLTQRDRQKQGESVPVSAIYTGIVPIVYKAQRALLASLVESIALAFLMIAVVMMILLRDWHLPFRFSNMLNLRGGLICMIPNVFPVVIVFGCMGLLGIEVDIGSMMTASVAMGIAVDDTIHFMNWYRLGLSNGLDRHSAIRDAYRRVGTAMTQTTLIAGLGLAAFALSTFTPTQRFGVMMFILLTMALIGDLILLPALLASPLGKYFGKEQRDNKPKNNMSGQDSDSSISPLIENNSNAEGPTAPSTIPLRIVRDQDYPPEVILPENSTKRKRGS